MTARYLLGDTRDVLATIPDGSIDLVLTSPPFLALRSYLPADHPDKHREIGSEPTPAEFLQTLLGLTAEWARVLAPHGSIAVELGDTYSGSSMGGGDLIPGSGQIQQPKKIAVGQLDASLAARRSGDGWPMAKSLCMIPQLYAASLSYGRNLLTGEPCDPWRVRNIVRWCRPNPPVGALGDKFRPGTSEITIACKSRTRYFDLDAVRGAPTSGEAGEVIGENGAGFRGITEGGARKVVTVSHPAGAPPLDWWIIPTQPYKGAHYATYPEALVVKPIEAMVPRKVCTVCGEPSRRIAVTTNAIGEATGRRSWRNDTDGKHTGDITRSISSAPTSERETLGWSDCGHNAWRKGIVLDPFAGSGTTLQVATQLGREAIGIDIDERNLELARDRIGLFMETA